MLPIFLYSHDPVVLSRWAAALQASKDLHTTGPGVPLATVLADLPRGVVIADLACADLDEGRALASLCAAYPRLRIIAAFVVMAPERAIELFEAGVRGYCNRYLRAELLVEVVRVVQEGEIWVGQQLMAGLLQALPRSADRLVAEHPLLQRLTEREREIVVQVMNGRQNKLIANDLGISERTVKAHVSSILHKLGVGDRMQLALLFNRPPAS